jgi:lactoylglutathione lyase
MAATLGFDVEPPAASAPGFELGFKVADVDHEFESLVAVGIEPVTPPTDRPWGQRTAYVRDPDGHLIELAQDTGGRDRADGADPKRGPDHAADPA